MNEKKTDDTKSTSEYENFESAVKRLLNVSSEEMERIKKEEKEKGIAPSPEDLTDQENLTDDN